jgi:hypothetical protein
MNGSQSPGLYILYLMYRVSLPCPNTPQNGIYRIESTNFRPSLPRHFFHRRSGFQCEWTSQPMQKGPLGKASISRVGLAGYLSTNTIIPITSMSVVKFGMNFADMEILLSSRLFTPRGTLLALQTSQAPHHCRCRSKTSSRQVTVYLNLEVRNPQRGLAI